MGFQKENKRIKPTTNDTNPDIITGWFSTKPFFFRGERLLLGIVY